MHRRTYLERLLAAGTVITLSGCTEQILEDAKAPSPAFDALYDEEELDLPVEQTYETVAENIERGEDVTFEAPEELREYLLDADLLVESLAEGEDHGETVLELEYAPEQTARKGNAHGLGIVAGGYAALVRGDYDGDALEASVLDSDGRKFGEFEVVTEWAEAYNDDGKTAAVYGGDILHTLESK